MKDILVGFVFLVMVAAGIYAVQKYGIRSNVAATINAGAAQPQQLTTRAANVPILYWQRYLVRTK